jgi:transcriptional regulator with XRE-family HTH domain
VDIDARDKLGSLVREARGSRSLRVFGDLFGVSATTVQGWERGEYLPGTVHLMKLATMSGFSFEELMSYVKGKHSQPGQVQRMLDAIELMSLEKVAVVAKAAVNRLATAVEVEGEAVDESDRPQPH